jgi:CII-binding regulator of phage lambda lysogenization HflD
MPAKWYHKLVPASQAQWNKAAAAILLLDRRQKTMATTVDDLKSKLQALVAQEAAFEGKVTTDLAAIAKVISDLKAGLSSNIAVTQADLDLLGGEVDGVAAGLTKVIGEIDTASTPAA